MILLIPISAFSFVSTMFKWEWLIVFQLLHGGQCTYPCFPGVLLTSTPHNTFSKSLAALPHNHCRNNGQQWERNESCRNDYHQSSERILAEPAIEPATPCSHVHNATDWAMRLGLSGNGANGFERILCEVLIKELQECMDRCTGRRHITERMLKYRSTLYILLIIISTVIIDATLILSDLKDNLNNTVFQWPWQTSIFCFFPQRFLPFHTNQIVCNINEIVVCKALWFRTSLKYHSLALRIIPIHLCNWFKK